MRIAIDERRCTGCGRCVDVCGINFFARPGAKPRAADPVETCLRCGHCIAVCPKGAITHDGLAGVNLTDISKKPGYEAFMALLEARRSRREFSDKPLSEEEIGKLLSAAVQAPNGLNQRNVRFTVITDLKALKELSLRVGMETAWLAGKLESPLWRAFFRLWWGDQLDEIEPLIPLLGPMAEETLKGNDKVLYGAPCAILVHTRESESCGPEDAVYCGANILLAAEALGLGACVIGFLTEPVNRDKGMARLAGIPKGRKVHTSIVVGHPRFPYALGISRKP